MRLKEWRGPAHLVTPAVSWTERRSPREWPFSGGSASHLQFSISQWGRRDHFVMGKSMQRREAPRQESLRGNGGSGVLEVQLEVGQVTDNTHQARIVIPSRLHITASHPKSVICNCFYFS